MRRKRKIQLNQKLDQIYTRGTGRTEGVMDSLLQEQICGHTYYIHKIGGSINWPPIEEYDKEDKSYTIVKVGLYQEGNSCIATFDIPFSTSELQKIASRIDMAYYYWMQREPSALKQRDTHEYYMDVYAVARPNISGSPYIIPFSREEFANIPEEDVQKIIADLELEAFLPESED